MTKYGMASSQVSSVTSPESGGRSEIPNLGGNDSSPILITGHKLNGHNYLQWSQSVLLFICGKGKDEYLTGEAVMPETTEPGFRKWKIENSMIMSWLINSMNNDIGENFLLFGTAKDIWDAAKETYSSSENTSELFQVESALHDFRQGEQSVTQYYNTLTSNIQEIVEQKRLFKFFLGLNRELDDVRGRIMGIKPLPSLREAFSEVRREESRKKVMMGSKEQPAPTLDASALAARSFNSSGGDRQKRDRPWCDYCKKPGHYKETCWKLHGKPADWKPKPRFDRDGRAHVAANSESTSVPEPSPFNKEQMEMLQKLLSQVGSGSTTGVAFTANRGGMRPWIVDTGASDHMTGDAAILQNYKPSNGHSSVHIADGSKSKIAGTGSIKLTKDLYLDSVLHVPNLDCNLLSISKLAHDLQCVTKFYPNLCVFQDLKSGKMIGSAELCSGLYLLSCGQFSNQVSQASCVQSQKSPNPSQFAPTELSTPMPPSVQPAQHTNVPSPVTIQSPMPIQPIAPQLANENLQVYIRRRKRQELEHGSQSTCGQYIDSNSSLPEENIGEDRAGEVLIPSIDDSTLPIALRKGVRRCTDHPIGNYVTYEGLSPSYRAFATSLDDTQVPNTIQEALKISEWKKAVQDEIDALEKNGTWTITDLPVGKRPVGCKWIFTIKYKADGSVERFKARLVARGFTQSYGIDYQETFAPVAKLNTIRILLSLAVNQDWCLQQLDIKNAFLNGDLEEEVYMEIPPGFEESMAKNQNLKKYLSEEFEVKDLGNLKYFLGMEVARSRKGIVVSQRKYILDLLKETGMLGCKPIDTPMDSQKKLGIEKESTPVDRGRYQRLVGRLIYLSHTRPDIGFAVSAVSQFMHSPTEEHMEAVYRILRYLKMTPGKGLFFRKTENRDTEVYSDADWAGNIIDRRSTSGYCSFVWGNLVTWRSKKQSVVARSSAEAEYRALAQGICEGIWIKRVLSELGQTSSSPILMMCDNQAAISIAKNPVHHDRTKHVEIDRHFITEKIFTCVSEPRLESTKGTYANEWSKWEKQLRDILFDNAEYLTSIQVPFESSVRQVLEQLKSIAKGDYPTPGTEKRKFGTIVFAAVSLPVTEIQSLLANGCELNVKIRLKGKETGSLFLGNSMPLYRLPSLGHHWLVKRVPGNDQGIIENVSLVGRAGNELQVNVSGMETLDNNGGGLSGAVVLHGLLWATRQPRFQHCQGHIEQLCNDGHSARLPLVPAINRGFPLSFSLFSLYLEFLPLQLSTTAFALPLAFLVMFYSDFLSLVLCGHHRGDCHGFANANISLATSGNANNTIRIGNGGGFLRPLPSLHYLNLLCPRPHMLQRISLLISPCLDVCERSNLEHLWGVKSSSLWNGDSFPRFGQSLLSALLHPLSSWMLQSPYSTTEIYITLEQFKASPTTTSSEAVFSLHHGPPCAHPSEHHLDLDGLLRDHQLSNLSLSLLEIFFMYTLKSNSLGKFTLSA
ncbi:Retrovirus-related Pol polyprotein from transposon RE1 [Vitis vinifera]|uniref:Retrovirus-related Pol polyprotein from transposon RE1 n=1 Tax=Vitis vinifera TaxID=29760 RepID=A0A438F9Y7_VITVI|nr:Retrovirus-related Pol polyprotein from transposon RE1 [Vitis vinifera]